MSFASSPSPGARSSRASCGCRASWTRPPAGLGADRLDVLARVHVPLLRSGLVTAALLVFVEVMKELPATLLLRPLGGDTMAIAVWQATHESLYKTAALPALMIVLVGPAAGGHDDPAVRAASARARSRPRRPGPAGSTSPRRCPHEPRADARAVEVVRLGEGRARAEPRHRARGAAGRARPVGLRQDDAAADDRRLRAAGRGVRGRLGRGGRRAGPHGAAGEAEGGDGLPGLRAVPAPHGRGRTWRSGSPSAARGARRHHPAHARAGRAPAQGRLPRVRAVRRRAPARGACPRARARPRARAAGRAVLEPRRDAARRAAPRGRADPARRRGHRAARDPRPGGGALAGGPAGRDARRPDRAGRARRWRCTARRPRAGRRSSWAR